MMQRTITALVFVAALSLVAACESAPEGQQGGRPSSSCDKGDTKACGCTSGQTGIKTCVQDNDWGACACSGGNTDTVTSDSTNAGDGVSTGDASDTSCSPACDGTQCGDDGCGGTCGGCQAGWGCVEGACVEGACSPDCSGKQCGGDGCGGDCGACPDGYNCSGLGQCTQGPCTPDCSGKQCGPDGCAGDCGVCGDGLVCDVYAQCVPGGCTPACAGKQCGSDGCGGTCGSCFEGTFCNDAAQCEPEGCTPNCNGKQCGDNGCGGQCGTCSGDTTCQGGQCQQGLACRDLYSDCFPACPTGPDGYVEEACAQDCVNAMTPTGQSEFNTFQNCLSQNGCFEAEDINACLSQYCFGEYIGCFHGNDSCYQVQSCMNGCGSDEECVYACLAEGSVDAQGALYGGRDECVIEACCGGIIDDCQTDDAQACIDEMFAGGTECTFADVSCP